MREKFFPGFTFTKAEKRDMTFERIPVPPGEASQMHIARERIVVDLTQSVEEPVPLPWTEQWVMAKFESILGDISRDTKQTPLSLKGRSVRFVPRGKLRPQSETERRYLIERYGDYIVDGGAGDCVKLGDGSYAIRIGYAGEEETIPEHTVVELVGHEYGHTLGDTLAIAVLEELKAYAFANLAMRKYYNVFVCQWDASTVHEEALSTLGQLIDRGIKEEMVIAHLTGEPFGIYQANDVLKYCNA